jgi:hypothetical protein
MQLATVTFEVTFPADYLRLEELMLGEVKQAASETAQAMSGLVRQKITEPDAQGRVIDDTHELLNSIENDIAVYEDHIAALCWSDVAHAAFIEEGRDPGFVSTETIIEWMLDKGIQPRAGETTEEAARAIALKISREGYVGRHIFEQSLEEADSIAIEALDRASARLSRRLS